MKTDMTAQTFREAAAFFNDCSVEELKDLLLAAAEQREQLDRVKVWLRTMDGYASTHIAVEGNFDELEAILYEKGTHV